MMHFLDAKDISFSYTDKPVLKNVTFNVNKGEIMGLLGPNGTGKTTLLKCIAGIYKINNGKITLSGRDLLIMPINIRSKTIGYVPQSINHAFDVTVAEFILMGRAPYIKFKPTNEDEFIVFETIKELEMQHLAFRNINQLSGGERQRVLIARAVAQKPTLLLMDEPTSSLDMKYQQQTMRIIKSLSKKDDITIMISIHDVNLAGLMCDKFLMLKDTSCFATGSSDILTKENILKTYEADIEVNKINGNTFVFLNE